MRPWALRSEKLETLLHEALIKARQGSGMQRQRLYSDLLY